MENPITEAKKELIQWITDMCDFEDLADLLELKERMTTQKNVAESQAEYAIKDDFDERFARGICGEEMRKRIHAHIESLPWKEK